MGFTVASLETHSIDDQIALLAHAEVIAGPFGAGLAWAAMSRHPTGLLLEVSDAHLVRVDYWGLAAACGWAYARTSDRGADLMSGD